MHGTRTKWSACDRLACVRTLTLSYCISLSLAPQLGDELCKGCALRTSIDGVEHLSSKPRPAQTIRQTSQPTYLRTTHLIIQLQRGAERPPSSTHVGDPDPEKRDWELGEVVVLPGKRELAETSFDVGTVRCGMETGNKIAEDLSVILWHDLG